jgi:hypothetical protein
MRALKQFTMPKTRNQFRFAGTITRTKRGFEQLLQLILLVQELNMV